MKRIQKNTFLKYTFILLASILFLVVGILPILHTTVKPTQAVQERNNTLNGMTTSQIASMSRYDGRDYNLVPSVKDQGSSNLCWAYTSSNVAEISILRSGITPSATKDTLSFNPKYLGNSVYDRGADPLKNSTGFRYNGNWEKSAGNYLYAADSFAQWVAPIESKETATPANWYEKASYRLTDSLEYSYFNGTSATMIPIIKKAVAEYGAVAAGTTYTGNRIEYYNPKYVSNGIGHAITIIGWDDSIDKSKFQPRAADQDGAWIVKNSYSNDPFFYLSYDSSITQFMALKFAPKDAYQYNYFYDSAGSKEENGIGGNMPNSAKKAANIFEAKGGATGIAEYIQAVNVHVSKETTCNVKVYTNLKDRENPVSGTLAAECTQTFDIAGYRTVQLPNPVKVNRGSYFSIVVEVSGSSSAKITFSKQTSKITSQTCNSYGEWSKSNGIPRIKAYTTTKQDASVIANDISNPTETTISLPYATVEYNGSPAEPIPTVIYKGTPLQINQDFTVKYEYNNRPGQVNVYIYGMNNYYGQRLTSFRIEKGSTPAITLDSITNVRQNDTLRQYASLLPQNWQWQNPDLVLDGNVTSAVAEYIGSDKDYYNNIQHTVAIYYQGDIVPPQPPVEPTPPDPVEPNPPVNPPVDPSVPPTPIDPSEPIQPPSGGDSSIGGGVDGAETKPPIENDNANNNGNQGNTNTPVDSVQNPSKKSNIVWIIIAVVGGLSLVFAVLLLLFLLKKRK